MTVPDVRRLLAVLLGDATQHAFHLHWSRWRRRRYADARRCHDQRRLARSNPEVPL